MPVTIEPLSKRKANWQIYHNIALGRFLDGQCYAFAIALHRHLGWPIVGLIYNGEIRHALVREPDGCLRDVRGIVPGEKIGEPFSVPRPYVLKDVGEEDLRDHDTGDKMPEDAIDAAYRLAEMLWPELPWEDSYTSRGTTFVFALQKLCEEHGMWIRGATSGSLPLIMASDVDERLSYTLRRDGLEFTLDRVFD